MHKTTMLLSLSVLLGCAESDPLPVTETPVHVLLDIYRHDGTTESFHQWDDLALLQGETYSLASYPECAFMADHTDAAPGTFSVLPGRCSFIEGAWSYVGSGTRSQDSLELLIHAAVTGGRSAIMRISTEP